MPWVKSELSGCVETMRDSPTQLSSFPLGGGKGRRSHCRCVQMWAWGIEMFLSRSWQGNLILHTSRQKKKKIVWSSFPRQWVLNRDLTWNDWHINLSGLLHEVHIWSNRQQWVFKHHNGPSCQRVFYRFTESSDTWLLCKHEGKKKFSENFAQINENLVSYVC